MAEYQGASYRIGRGHRDDGGWSLRVHHAWPVTSPGSEVGALLSGLLSSPRVRLAVWQAIAAGEFASPWDHDELPDDLADWLAHDAEERLVLSVELHGDEAAGFAVGHLPA